MPLQLGNANSCTVHLQPSRTTRTSSRLTLPDNGKTVSAATVLSRIQFIRWDGVSKQPSALIDCIIPREREAVAATREYFLRGDGAGIGRRAREERAPNVSAMGHDFYDGMTCVYDSGFNTFDCDGEQCVYGGNAMWVDADVGAGTVASSSNTAALGDPSGQYACDNGCTLWANGLGGVGFYCPEDEGDGDEPGGGEGEAGPRLPRTRQQTIFSAHVQPFHCPRMVGITRNLSFQTTVLATLSYAHRRHACSKTLAYTLVRGRFPLF